jgi:hypothetical protein
VSAAAEEFHARGRAAVLGGRALIDQPPSAASPRWGVSVILRPDAAAAERLDATTALAVEVAGPGHWPTGRCGSGHLTVRGLEPYREPVTADDPAVERYATAVGKAAATAGSPEFAMTGLVLVPGGVLVVATPVDGTAAELRAALADELGPDGAFEDDAYRQGLWWSTLVHFAAPLTDGAGLVEWVEARRTLDLGAFRARSVDVVRYAYDGASTSPVVLATVPLET